tara:strand:+ start:4271 stop:5062 length:792 start_codon:yes stop_codon:yes gene_type:complete
MSKKLIKHLNNCLKIRSFLINSLFKAGSGHPGSSLSLIEILYYIYNFEKNFKLILSKGHGVPGQYAVMKFFNQIDNKNFYSLRKINSKAQGHPDRRNFKKIDASTGALGQGLSIAIGYAMAKEYQKKNGYVYCILGDGELQEGQIWESLMFLNSNYLKKLIIIVDYNKFQNEDLISKTLPMPMIKKKWQSFGFKVFKINGHSLNDLHKTIKKVKTLKKPSVIIADTIKGKGISFMENSGHWHSAKITQEFYSKAIQELNDKKK